MHLATLIIIKNSEKWQSQVKSNIECSYTRPVRAMTRVLRLVAVLRVGAGCSLHRSASHTARSEANLKRENAHQRNQCQILQQEGVRPTSDQETATASVNFSGDNHSIMLSLLIPNDWTYTYRPQDAHGFVILSADVQCCVSDNNCRRKFSPTGLCFYLCTLSTKQANKTSLKHRGSGTALAYIRTLQALGSSLWIALGRLKIVKPKIIKHTLLRWRVLQASDGQIQQALQALSKQEAPHPST